MGITGDESNTVNALLLPPVPVHQFLPEPLLHRLLPQGHGTPERGETLARGSGPHVSSGGLGMAQSIHGLSSSSPFHSFLLSVCPSIYVSSLCLSPPHLSVCLSIGPFTAPAHPVPVPEPRAAASGSAGPAHGPEVPPAPPLPSGPPAPGPGQSMGRWRAPGAGSVALLGASCQAEGACCGEMVLHWLGAGGRGPSSPQAHWLLQAGWPQVLGKSGWECCGWEQANSGRGCRGWGLCPGTSRRAS